MTVKERKLTTSFELGKSVATREAYGKSLLELGGINSEVVVLDADLSGSTQTKHFAKEYPERFFNMGIAEANMMATAAGMARAGKVPFASSFAMFATGRAWEQVRNSIAHNHVSVKICATHAGLTLGEDGASHQIIEDLAITRAIPGLHVFCPADANETVKIIEQIADYNHPVYIRLGRAKVPVINSADYKFEIGKSNILKEGKDVTLIACGVMVSRALEAAEILEKEHKLTAEVINAASIKPFDAMTLVNSATKTQKVISIEEHNINGGLGDIAASALSEHLNTGFKFAKMGVNDEFGQSGKGMELLDFYGLGVEHIVKKALALQN